MTNKDKYIRLCADENYVDKITIFAQSFWLDAVAENWDVFLVETHCMRLNKLQIIAALPFCWKGNLITKRIYLPDFSFYQSIIFLKDDLFIKEKNKIAQELFKQLPKTIKSYFKFTPENIDIELSKLRFQKENYNTYIIDKNTTELKLSTNHKRNIQKGIKQQFIIKESKNIEQSYALLTSTFSRQEVKPKISLEDFNKINSLVKKQKSGKTTDCFDKENNLLASVFIVVDSQTTYYLFGGYNSTFKNSGAMTFLLHHAIQSSLKQQKDFNFCGSTKKSIATFFEGFGVTKTEIAIWKKSIL